jgi:hypothetical protein
MLKPYIQYLLLWAGLNFVPSVAWAASVTASLDRESIIVGETTGLHITVQDGRPQSMESFPPIPGITIQQQGTSQSTTIVNGQMSSAIIMNFAVTASQVGEYTIPSVKVLVDGTQQATQPLKITASKADPQAQSRYAFLTLKVPREEVYVGEMIPVDLQLYVTQAEDIQAPQLKSDGFIIHKQPPNTRGRTQVGNTIYNVLAFKMSLSAAKAGELMLGPAEMNLTLLLKAQADPNDFFGEVWGRYQKRSIKLSSQSYKMHVLPMPTNAPVSFSGAIGQFNWTASADPKTVNAGDPITLKLAISGVGNFDAVKLPTFDWPDFKAYQPNGNVESQDPLGLSGSKTFEQVIVPQNSGVHEIPEIHWSFFDPVAKQYKTLSQPAVPIQVNAVAGGQPSPTVLAGKAPEAEETEQHKDIVHIKASPGQFALLAPPLVQRPWFLMIQAIPLAGFVSVKLWRKRKENLANNPKLRRKLEVQKIVHDGIERLGELASNNQADDFYALLFRLLQEQLGERLDLPASAITEAVLNEKLPRRGASPGLIEQLHELFQICNQARYAPIRTNQQLMEIQHQTASALGELQALSD